MKTNELQQLTSILGTDSLLIDAAAAGTGRLTLARAAQFFDQELLKPGTQISASLSQKAAKSVQETVEKTVVPTRTVELTAEELPAYIAGLPRLLSEYIIIDVSGTLDEQLKLENFYGSGGIQIEGLDGFTVTKGIRIFNCNITVVIGRAQFQEQESTETQMLIIDRSCYVSVIKCSFVGIGPNNAAAIWSTELSVTRLVGVSVSNCRIAIASVRGSIVCMDESSGDYISTFSNNVMGAYVWNGGIMILGKNFPDTLGAPANIKSGGLIVKADGTLL